MFLLMVDSLENESDRDFILGVYQDNKRLMYYTAKKYVNEQEECEEIVQDCICKLINKIDVIRKLNQYALLSYIVSTVRNSAITYGLQKRKEQERFEETRVELDACNAFYCESPETLIERIESMELINELWEKLSYTDRLLLEGKYILGYSDIELANQLSCKIASVRMKLTRARRRAMAIISDLE